MKRFIVGALAALMVIVTPVGIANANTVVEWQAPDPKQGTEGFIRCTGKATAGGVTYINHNWQYMDGDYNGRCVAAARHDVKNFFKFNHASIRPILTESIEISDEDVTVHN